MRALRILGRSARSALCGGAALLVSASPLLAGGARAVQGTGEPLLWNTASPIVYRLDQGALGSLTNAEADELVQHAFSLWGGTGVASVAFVAGSDLPLDVNSEGTPWTNPAHWSHFWRNPTDGVNPVIYDADGSVIDGMFGAGARFDILGAGAIDNDSADPSTTVAGGSIVINGAFFDGIPLPASPDDAVSVDAFEAIVVHEIGHFLNLDHSVVNHELAGDGDPDNDVYLPTMYPLVVDDEEAIVSLNPDDIAALGSLYPSPTFAATTAAVYGSVVDGGVPFQGADVVVRRAAMDSPDDPLMYAYAGISGARYFPCRPGGPCPAPDPPLAAAGEFRVQGIAFGDYGICVRQIDTRLSYANGTFIGPLATPATIAGPEECFDPAESADPAVDDPEASEVFTLGPGNSLEGVVVLVNALPEAGSFTDPFEPNDALGAAASLPGLADGVDTAPAILAAGDLDVYAIPAEQGATVSIDVDAAEFGSSLDPVVAVYGPSDSLIDVIDDALDPDSGSYTLDPAYAFVAPATGSFKVAVSAYPDLDLNGSGQASSGPYWIRVRLDQDQDADGVFDRFDGCPSDPEDDADRDGVCGGADNCPSAANPGQEDAETAAGPDATCGTPDDNPPLYGPDESCGTPDDGNGDGIGSACDDCPSVFDPGQGNEDGDGAGDACDPCPLDPGNDADGDGACGNGDNCPTYPNPAQDGGAPVRISGAMVSEGDVSYDSEALAPRFGLGGSRAVYAADQNTDGVTELFSVLAGGDGRVRLNPALSGPPGVTSFTLTPDGARVVFIADALANGAPEVYSAPVDGSAAAVSLTGAQRAGIVYYQLGITADGSRVFYRADQAEATVVELYSVPVLGGSSPVKLNAALASGGDVLSAKSQPNGTRIVYRADQDTDETFELYSVPAAGGTAPTKLNVEIGAHVGSAGVTAFDIGSDGAKAVYLLTPASLSGSLLSVAVTGGASTNLVPLSGFGVLSAFRISPNGAKVVFLSGPYSGSSGAIGSVPIGGGTETVLEALPWALPSRQFAEFTISPDGSRVTYIADQIAYGQYELFGVPIGGGTSVRLSGTLVTEGDVAQSLITPDGSRVVFVASKDSSNPEIYSAPIDGSTAPVHLSQTGAVIDPNPPVALAISPDSKVVVYRATLPASIHTEMFSVPAGGGAITRMNNATLPEQSAAVKRAAISEDSRRAIYVADQLSAGVFELFGVALVSDLDGDGKLNLCDNCQGVPNPAQADLDGDGAGDACDNCPRLANPGQEDAETAAGPDATCGTSDDNPVLYGPDGLCGTPDDAAGDGIGDACPAWTDATTPAMAAAGDSSTAAAWADYDNDGDLDLFFTNFGSANRLFRNDGGGVFADVSAPPLNDVSASRGVSWGDHDNDGDLDLYVANSATPNRLYGNDGGGAFTDITSGPLGDAGITFDAPWVDYDGDGDLDLYLVNTGSSCRLLRNDGGGNFTDVSAAPLNLTGNARKAAWGDYNDDGAPDLYLVMDGERNRLFRNDGDGVFADVSAAPLDDSGAGRGASWGDYDDDGDLDLLLTRYTGGARLFRNDGGGSFTDVTPPAFASVIAALGSGWADVDNDGDLDLYVSSESAPGRLFRNDGAGAFVEQTTGPLQSPDGGGEGVAWGDFDGDGDLDLFVARRTVANRLVVNQANNGNHWIEIDLRGAASNRAAIGARVAVHTPDGAWQIREISGGTGYAAQSALTAHFGLGANSLVDAVAIRWPTGVVQNLPGLAADRRVTLVESVVDVTAPHVVKVLPADGAQDAALGSSVTVVVSEALDPDSVTSGSVKLVRGSHKVSATLRLSADGRIVTLDPQGSLQADSVHTLHVNEASGGEGLRDLAGNLAMPFSSSFDTAASFASAQLSAGSVGTTGSGAVIPGTNADDQSGYANALAGDVDGNGLADIVVGAPNADDGSAIDAGKATLVFGSPGLLSASTPVDGVEYLGETAYDHAGYAVSRAGDVDGDGHADFLIGAPGASPNGTGSGKVYLVFGDPSLSVEPLGTYDLGNLSACASPALCGVVFEGEAAGDQAGYAVAGAGDVNGDGLDDILVGAPGASPGGLGSAGKVYLVYGPLASPGVVLLSSVGSTTPGIVFHGEGAGHAAGAALSRWEEYGFGKVDDLLIGAPGASVIDENGATIANAGYVYAIWGGVFNLDAKAVGGVIALSRVAGGQPDEVKGFVFIGVDASGQMGRSVTGAIDLDGDGIPDIAIGGSQEAWVISGGGPKAKSGSGTLNSTPSPVPTSLTRTIGGSDVESLFGAIRLASGTDGDPGGLAVGAAGDVNDDGFEDLIVGARGVDAGGNADAGRAYILFGGPSLLSGEILLSDVGRTVFGLVVDGYEAGDELGRSVDGGYDVNGDGIADALVGAPFADALPATPANAGESYVVSPVAPLEVTTISMARSGAVTSLEWTVPVRALRYNVYRGSLAVLRARGGVLTSDMVRLACGIRTDDDLDGLPDTTDPAVPSTGETFFYLVTGANDAGEGPIGPAGASPPRSNDAQCP